LVDALQIAFPIVFEAQMVREDVTSLAELLQCACKKPLTSRTTSLLEWIKVSVFFVMVSVLSPNRFTYHLHTLFHCVRL
jgi:hypothetical protein